MHFSLTEVKSPVGQILHHDKTVLAVEQNKILMPPLYNKYVAWGFADHSLRIGVYDTDKAVFVSESVVHNSGEIVACVCPSSKLIITAGTSSVSVRSNRMRVHSFCLFCTESHSVLFFLGPDFYTDLVSSTINF